MLVSRRPAEHELTTDYHRGHLNRVSGDDVIVVLRDQLPWLCDTVAAISTDLVDSIQAPYSWTIRQVFAHLAETERLMGYRLMCFAAGDPATLPGLDENQYAAAKYGLGNFTNLVEELGLLRRSNILLLQRLRPACWDMMGAAENHTISVRGLAWVVAGHLQHHLQIVQQRLEIESPMDGCHDCQQRTVSQCALTQCAQKPL
ncbi:MAG: DinB family protein [Planctomycetota bacterium]